MGRLTDFVDALSQGAMELFGVAETVTFDRAAAEKLGWRLLGEGELHRGVGGHEHA